MKKLLVLAAVAAMAMGAKAEYYTVEIPDENAKAVYFLSGSTKELPSGWGSSWEGMFKPVLLDETTARRMFGGESWTETYANFELGSAEMKFAPSEGGTFNLDTGDQPTGYVDWMLIALDATEFSPGAAYAVYRGTSGSDIGPITLGSTPIDSGYLMTDSPTPVPEPTSGLMLLLGVAGLALKRKRA